MARSPQDAGNWNLASRDGAECVSIRRWAILALEKIVTALAEMQELTEQLRVSDGDHPGSRRRMGAATHVPNSERRG